MTASPATIILCPLRFEQQTLTRIFRRRGKQQLEFHCCGPGVAAIDRWFSQVNVADRAVILAGLAGGLTSSISSGDALWASRVVGSDGRVWIPNWGEASVGSAQTVIASSDTPLLTPADKRTFAQLTGAALVDMESAAFAAAAERSHCRWAIVRGVSDDASTRLPLGVEHWVNDAGGTRLWSVLAAVVRRPWVITDLIHLQRTAGTALAAVAEALARLPRIDAS